LLLLVVVLAVSACSDDSGGASTSTTGSSTSGTAADGSVSSTTAGTTTPTTADSGAPEQVGEPFISGLVPIVQLTPLADGGPRPLLEWEPVEGAVRYDVTLYAPDGAGYWAWHGAETSVVVGQLATAEQSGPRVSPGMTWAVLALDEGGIPIASSAVRPISP
jgi:hypothetical protein